MKLDGEPFKIRIQKEEIVSVISLKTVFDIFNPKVL